MTLLKKNICVFCGSVVGNNSAFSEVATQLGTQIATSNFNLVYGGGSSGLMGLVAKAALQNNGHVIGVMPSSLVTAESVLLEITEYHEVKNFHERKMLMSTLSDAFIVLPGGPGTLEELIEQIFWAQCGYHTKPIFIVNTEGYWNQIIKFLECIKKKSTFQKNSGIYFIVDRPDQAIGRILEIIQEQQKGKKIFS